MNCIAKKKKEKKERKVVPREIRRCTRIELHKDGKIKCKEANAEAMAR